jgi:hypothetical protein
MMTTDEFDIETVGMWWIGASIPAGDEPAATRREEAGT